MEGQSSSISAAEGYRQTSLSVQKVDGEMFIQSDVCPQAGDAILDLGCGTGELSAYLAGLVGPEGKVIGVDPDKERIQLARKTHSEIKNLSFVDGSASDFPGYCSESYDIVFSNHVIHWIADKQQVFHNMFESLKVGGKIAFHYITHLPPFSLNAYKELNPENAERICQMYQCEPKAKIEEYCSLAGFEIIRSYEAQILHGRVFEDIDSLLQWHWSSTHGVFDPSLVTEERLQTFLAPYISYSGEDRTPCLDFRGNKEETPVCRLVAVKKESSTFSPPASSDI